MDFHAFRAEYGVENIQNEALRDFYVELMALNKLPAIASGSVESVSNSKGKHVVSFSELPPVEDWMFKTGLAYPIRAEINGTTAIFDLDASAADLAPVGELTETDTANAELAVYGTRTAAQGAASTETNRKLRLLAERLVVLRLGCHG